MSDKTLPPSEQKLRDARTKGQVPRSRLFSAASVTASAVACTLAFADETTARFKNLAAQFLSLSPIAPSQAIHVAMETLALTLLPTLIGALLGSIVSSMLMAGLQLNVAALSPQWERVDFVEGCKKLFSARTMVDTLKSLAVAALMFVVLWKGSASVAALMFAASTHDGPAALSAGFSLAVPIIARATALLFLLGLADFGHARFRHLRDLMMSHDDVKREHKSSEGDPHAKHERKALARKLAQSGPARGVHRATAIVVNPTHIAVALRYVEAEGEVPYIVAKGRDADAFAIRKIANELKIPIVKDVPFARSLIHYDVGEEVPEELYQAAAAVLKVALTSKNEVPSLTGEKS